MKQIFIAGNWKSNKTTSEAIEWLREFKIKTSNFKLKTTPQVVLCASFTLLYPLKKEISRLGIPIKLGAQDVSPYGAGAYTGAVNAVQIKEIADWVIIGHSERRKFFSETDELLQQEVEQAKSAGLGIIYCVPDDTTIVPGTVDVVAYEPVWAIGTGKSDTPENANSVIQTIKTVSKAGRVIYGGSVTRENVASFIAQPMIDGVLPGGASLSPETFYDLLVALAV
ncbi:hypothetical protein A2973_01585 [Candidatus Gottesmanbacteria bacterium RIFCSPLOWO2_01_FULL_49_10]|uniref:Triosephosphate isomerase n=1 Tax=Candidatus Gottesmanbacteria bacterium RIFCSPLOWO2_01_FULL_49_10 TaxID=1798396 RepID=A0A1F6AXE1_9BACT|nr:MAG: Triosephosphate isomerase [Microgenomates group bacterium GW2011_GWA2_47_8]OGG29162.1 MAG: hypothetical protein A2973_01585 [Candidatus Gottesmanbacteria bacterium RIFCSPLOWO2_01_FULL_49_10]